MSEETMKAAREFVNNWAPLPEDKDEFIQDLAYLISTVGREIIVNALRRAE